MNQIKHIMVAVDLSEYSLPSLKYAHGLASALGAEIVLVNIHNERDIRVVRGALTAYSPDLIEKLSEENIKDREKKVAQLVDSAGAGASVTQRIIRIGVPAQALLEIVEAEKPDLVVISSKGRTNLADTLVGSCARVIYRRSPVPVLMLPRTIAD